MANEQYSILFIEDELEITEAVKEFFEDNDFKFTHSTKANDALRKAKDEVFDCILTDINLDASKGDEFIRKLRSNPDCLNRNTPIIALSSHFDSPLLVKIGPNIQGVYVKPYNLIELLNKVNQLIADAKK